MAKPLSINSVTTNGEDYFIQYSWGDSVWTGSEMMDITESASALLRKKYKIERHIGLF